MKTVQLQSGVTLIELLITIAVGAILLAVVAPGFNTIIQDNRLSTSANQLVSYLSLARSEAIKRGVAVSLCKSNNPPASTCNNALNWEDGWVVFEDQNDNGIREAGDTLIRVHQGLPKNTLRGDANLANSVCFSSRGFADPCGGLANGTFSLCDNRADPNKARSIIIALTGRVSTTTTTGGCP